jgi:hypothetical protein
MAQSLRKRTKQASIIFSRNADDLRVKVAFATALGDTDLSRVPLESAATPFSLNKIDRPLPPSAKLIGRWGLCTFATKRAVMGMVMLGLAWARIELWVGSQSAEAFVSKRSHGTVV